MTNSTALVAALPLPASVKRFVEATDFIRVLGAALVFGLVVLVTRSFGLENRAFVISLALVCVCFPVHHLLPSRFKLPFFVLISFTATGLTVGVINAIWLISLGSVFIVLAHLPIKFWVRVTLQIALCCLMIVFRADLLPSVVPAAIWPILGSMFIFRMMIYMYDLRGKATEFGFWRSLAYFFMVPNVNFTLLPVIDYKGLFSVYYPKNKPAIDVYHKGVALLVRGVIHLLLYRFVYQNLLVDPVSIVDASDALQYLIATFLLYLRISGYFHMISGILHMYGFDLPETHHLYFLASSFTDFWRRINIFWKDFMQKIFFYPVHFWLSRRYKPITCVVAATGVTFFITWFLHAYQWFWIRGDFKLSLQDALFWGSLGVVVLINMLIEIKFPKKKTLKAPKRTWKSELALASKTILTFFSIVFIWNVWSTPDFGELAEILTAITNFGQADALNVILFCVLLGGFAVVYGHRVRGDSGLFVFNSGKKKVKQNTYWPSIVQLSCVMLVLLFLKFNVAAIPGSPDMVSVLSRLTENELNERDRKLLQRGYYEDLTDVSRFNPELQALYRDKPVDWVKSDLIVQAEGEFPPYKLLPSGTSPFHGATLTSNSWGMRDMEYSEQKPANTYRAAITGASHTFGSGVNNGENYESLLEERINTEFSSRDLGKFELLNMSLGGFGPACKISMLEQKAQALNADGLIYVAIDDFYWAVLELSVAQIGQENPAYYFAPVREIARQAGVVGDMSRAEAAIRLSKYKEEIVTWYYRYLYDLAQNRGVDLWMVFIPVPEDQSKVRAGVERQMEIAREIGINVLDITDTYSQIDLSSLWVARFDKHPNVEGHHMLADRLYEEFYSTLVGAVESQR